MEPWDVLRAYLSARAVIGAADYALIERAFTPRTVRAGDYIQRAGEPARFGMFVAHGCLRAYVIDSAGGEHIIQFAPEEWWYADVESLATGNSSRYFVDAVEDSELLLIEPAAHQQLIDRVPGYAAAFRIGIQRHAASKDKRIAGTLTSSAQERYEELLGMYPALLRRVPQWMLASYLGITPETLSRIRARAARKHRS